MRNEVIELVTEYKDGKEIKSQAIQIMAKKKSLNRAEFYAAFGVGLTPSFVFVVNPSEYELSKVTVDDGSFYATHVKYGDKQYKIIRTYETSRFEMELTVG